MSRQQERAQLRKLSNDVLKSLVDLPRSVRRIGARAYANQAYRDRHQLRTPARHHYRPIHLTPSVRGYLATTESL